jgi:hypothetical protein
MSISINLIIIAAAVVVAGIAIGVVYNKLVIKDYPPRDKKIGCVVSVIVFFLISVALFGVLFGRTVGISVIDGFTQKMAQQINDKYAQDSFVKEGVNIKDIGTDPLRAGIAIGAIRLALPGAADLGIPKMIYDMTINFVTGQMRSSLTNPEDSEKFVQAFTENNILTVSSLTGGLRQKAVNVVNITTLVLVGIFVILLGIYLLVTMSHAAKQRRISAGQNENNANEGTANENA